MARYLPAYREANIVNGKVIALPYFADAQFLYYRKDLLEKYKRPPPKTWDELRDGTKKIMDGEKNAEPVGLPDRRRADRRHGVHLPRAAVGQGGDLTKNGKLNLDTPESQKPFELWAG